MRPNYVVVVTTEVGRLIRYDLFYNFGKARRAYGRLYSRSSESHLRSSDGQHKILSEDGQSATFLSGEYIVRFHMLSEYINTEGAPWKKSFFDTSEEEFQELAVSKEIPVEILKAIANCEREYIEDYRDARWSAWKRAYLPRFFFDWI